MVNKRKNNKNKMENEEAKKVREIESEEVKKKKMNDKRSALWYCGAGYRSFFFLAIPNTQLTLHLVCLV